MADERSAFVVDDEAQWRSFVSNALRANGYEAHAFGNHTEVVVALATLRPRLVVLDLSLGDSDAVEVIRSLAAAKFSGAVLLMSGHGEQTLADVQTVADRHGLRTLPPLHKPFRVADLRGRLALVPSAGGEVGLDASLSSALENNWLELWYQPKVDLATGLNGGAEALIRLRHPTLGLLQPGSFLPAAGDPLYVPMTEFVGRQAMTDWIDFAKHGMTKALSINVPASVLQRPDFVMNLRRYFPKAPDFPGLIVEVTEDETIADLELAREIAVQLKLYNVRVSIDDFGSGFSTLGRLTELPFAEIKLDQSFVRGCPGNDRKLAMCRAVVELARRFNITSVAEGVETRDELKIVADLGYDMAQGFLYARPMPADEFVRFLHVHRRGSRPSSA